jgi:hypothetical protein
VLLGELAQPFGREVDAADEFLDGEFAEALEATGEDAVEAIDAAFVLHEARAGEIVEALGVVEHDLRVERVEEGQILAERGADSLAAQFGEEPREHGVSPRPSGRRGRG